MTKARLSTDGVVSNDVILSDGVITNDAIPGDGLCSNEGIPTDGLCSNEGIPTDGLCSNEGIPADGLCSSEGIPTDGLCSSEGIPTDGLCSSEGIPTDGLCSSEGIPTDGLCSNEGIATDGLTSSKGIPADDLTSSKGIPVPVTFSFRSLPLRTINRGGEIWFVAVDVCAALEISNPSQAVARLDDDERDVFAITDQMCRQQNTLVINESGLYTLVLTSRKEEARRFKRWVTHEVLPAIRATGQYKARRPRAQRPARQPEPLLPAAKHIRSRDDLSFTQRDAKGRLINWIVPDRPGNWHEHYGIGAIWFNEIIELARHRPEEAYHAMRLAGADMSRYWNRGHPEGFFDRMAQWAMTAILANTTAQVTTEPQLPFETPALGVPPREGMGFYLSGANGTLN